MCYGILGSGALSGKYLSGAKPKDGRITLWPEYFNRYMSKGAVPATEKYAKLAQKHDMSLTQMAVAWGLSRPFMLSIILGATKISQLQEQVSAADIHLSEELQQGILEIHQQLPNPYLIK
jgi:aryl-alcohol dehydrogenase-like predicted oxidoreductase